MVIALTTRDVNGNPKNVRSFQFLFPFSDEFFCCARPLNADELSIKAEGLHIVLIGSA